MGSLKKRKRLGKLKEKKLKFDPVKHKYSLGNVQLKSVTEFIETFFEPFDRDYWASYVADRDGKTKQKVLREWKEKTDWGDKVHKIIEGHIKGKRKKNYPNQALVAIDFLKSFSNAKIKSEVKVYSREWIIAGIIDVVIETPEGVMLLDWKTTSNLKMENSYRKAKAPIANLDDCNYTKYILQLNFYKVLFEQQFGKKVIEMGFAKLADVGPLEYFQVEDLSHEINLMIEHGKQRDRTREAEIFEELGFDIN